MRGVYLSCIGAALVLSACGSGTTAPSGTPVATLSGTASDPTGDATITAVFRNGLLVTPFVPVLPDLTGAVVDVSGGTLTATITFVGGTLSRTNTSACLLLDIDESAATGAVSAESSLGFDYSVCGVNPRGSTTGAVSRLGGGVATFVGSVGVTFPTANQVRFSVPLATLGNDDGRMAFKVNVIQYVDDPVVLNTNPIDWMPDVGRGGALIR